MKRLQVKELYYITHIDNMPSILKQGILSHEQIQARNIPYTPIYDEEIVSNRRDIVTPDGRSLWSFANLYFQPRNPMLYRVLHEKSTNDIAILSVLSNILDRPDIFVSTGNAAHGSSDILQTTEIKKALPQILRNTLNVDWWNEVDGSKRKIMAECLVPEMISPDQIQSIYVASRTAKKKLETTIESTSLAVVSEPRMFLLPARSFKLTPKLSLIDGDMFFSRMQTLTVSVNTVGVMGKGLASRAKYQFPDVYVYYQDSCRTRKLQMGRPQLYKREVSIEHELADEPSTLQNNNAEKWFLLFPTKRHWRERADMRGIEEGLQWLTNSYAKEKIRSLAIPALGCGLGGLEWRDVGPLMCRYLKTFDIQVAIYLPAEKEVDTTLLDKQFLLS
jgi:hypothetical protein